MISVQEAEKIVLQQAADYGAQQLPFEQALGHVLAEPLLADRDLPPCDRSTMDGIAISYDAFLAGMRTFSVVALQAAADEPYVLTAAADCIEVMTGAAISAPADTVIRYEDIDIHEGRATLKIEHIKKGQNIHRKGVDKKAGEVIVPANTLIAPAVIAAAAFTGNTTLSVRKQPSVIIFSNGDELLEVSETRPPHRIRRSNVYAVAAALKQYNIAAATRHLPDEEAIIEQELRDALQRYDVIIMSGGVSMGKYDLVANVLERLSVRKLFHKVQQRPGKPFWFGLHAGGTRVFAFPGNPVSTFMCLHRYFLPWYFKCLGLQQRSRYAVLGADHSFAPALQYFLQVKLHTNETGQLVAIPVEGNGSGDLSNLAVADAFMELPMELNNFKKGDVYPLWPFTPLVAV